MKEIIFTNLGIKGIIVFIIVGLAVLSLCINLRRHKDDKANKGKIIISHIIISYILFTIVLHFPLDGLMNFNSVEDAFKFQNPEGKLIYKKQYKNTTFVHGAEVYKSEKEHSYPGVFTFYSKEGKSWKSQHEGYEFIKNRVSIENKSGATYYLYYLYNEKDNITGVFIHALFSDNQFTEDTKIGDSKNTEFEGFYGLSRTTSDTKGYMFLGIIEGKIDKKYYISIDNEKIYLKDFKKY